MTDQGRATVAGTPRDGARWLLPAGAVLLLAVLAVYLADLATHLSSMAAMRDLVVYRNGGLIVRTMSSKEITVPWMAHKSIGTVRITIIAE